MIKTYNLLPMGEVIRSAWQKLPGFKLNFWGALVVFCLVNLAMIMTKNLLVFIIPMLDLPISTAILLINYLLSAGIIYMAIKQTQQSPSLTYRDVFYPFDKAIVLSVLGYFVLKWGVAAIAFMLPSLFLKMILGIVYIYLLIRFILTLGIILDQRVDVITALKQSYHATRGNFWRLIGLNIFAWAVLFTTILPSIIGFFILGPIGLIIGFIPCLIVLFWVLPYMYLIYGEVYNELAGMKKIEAVVLH